MISRISSGSSRADIAVDPTRSQNITVSCRRSAASTPATPTHLRRLERRVLTERKVGRSPTRSCADAQSKQRRGPSGRPQSASAELRRRSHSRESGLILAQSEAAQPVSHVHRRTSRWLRADHGPTWTWCSRTPPSGAGRSRRKRVRNVCFPHTCDVLLVLGSMPTSSELRTFDPDRRNG